MTKIVCPRTSKTLIFQEDQKLWIGKRKRERGRKKKRKGKKEDRREEWREGIKRGERNEILKHCTVKK